jgi:N-acetylmuramoyl-L-alanine amidase
VAGGVYAHGPAFGVDPGHGGYDGGAMGCGKVQEKNICLAIGKQVGTLLEQQGYEVIFTRKDDSFVSLDERTYCAHVNSGDFLVSFMQISSNHLLWVLKHFI